MNDRRRILPDDHPHVEIFWQVVPAWHDASSEDLDRDIGAGYACGFAAGFERGVVTAMLKLEWAQGFYRHLRDYYLKTHSEDDLRDWDERASETARAMPVRLAEGLQVG